MTQFRFEAACEGKLRFCTATGAWTALKQRNKRRHWRKGQAGGRTSKVYRCSHCHGWHLGRAS